ncbi:hypothetical protein ABZZ48_39065, partial [Kitasatospora indigofera]
LQGGVPATALYVMQFIDTDDRVREAFQAATRATARGTAGRSRGSCRIVPGRPDTLGFAPGAT